MNLPLNKSSIETLRADLPASLVVFFVAIPLCLGISLASGAPLISGIIAGILGGVIAGILSGSQLSVAGPAAGLSSIVLTSIDSLGTFQAFSVAVVFAGLLQILFGLLKAGAIGYFFPSAVIKGMLAGIGVILILKQIPHAFGDDRDFEGDESFFQADNENTVTEIINSVMYHSTGALFISLTCLGFLIWWGSGRMKAVKWTAWIPGPLVAVVLGIVINTLFTRYAPGIALDNRHLVDLPEISGIGSMISLPDWSVIGNSRVYVIALTLALVASLETLLSIEAADKMDPYRRLTPLDRELKAQGITNLTSGLLGGLPVTSVIVRTSANINSGAQTRVSAIGHGILLAVAVLAFPEWLELIPLSALAAILLLVGYKLVSPSLWVEQWNKGREQFIPFAVTIMVIVFSNLLLGIFIGMLISVYFVLKTNFQSALMRVNNGNNYLLKFTKDVSFLNKTTLVNTLSTIPKGASVLIEGSSVRFFDNDILEVLTDFQRSAPKLGIQAEVKKTPNALHPYFKSE